VSVTLLRFHLFMLNKYQFSFGYFNWFNLFTCTNIFDEEHTCGTIIKFLQIIVFISLFVYIFYYVFNVFKL